MNVLSLSIPVVALIFSAAALVVALLSAALSLRVPQSMRAGVQGEPAPSPLPVLAAEDDLGAWHGNVEEGYTRGSFSVKRMPTRGADAWRGNETEWVAYSDGERVAASPDLADVLAFCEGLG